MQTKMSYRMHKIHRRRPLCKGLWKGGRYPILFASTFAIVILVFLFMIFYGNKADIPKDGSLVAIAESQVGNKGGKPYWSWYGFDEHVDWCACFVSWCADQCGYIKAEKSPKFSYCPDGVSWFISNKSWYPQGLSPEEGMIIFFDRNSNGEADHVGIVKECKDDIVYAIEGNSGDQCRERRYPVGSSVIYGYGKIS